LRYFKLKIKATSRILIGCREVAIKAENNLKNFIENVVKIEKR